MKAHTHRGGGGGGLKHRICVEIFEIFLNTFMFFFARRLLVREVHHVQEYPYPVSGKLTQLFKQKQVPDSVPPPHCATFPGLARRTAWNTL